MNCIHIYNPAAGDVEYVDRLVRICNHSDYIRRQLRPNMKMMEDEGGE